MTISFTGMKNIITARYDKIYTLPAEEVKRLKEMGEKIPSVLVKQRGISLVLTDAVEKDLSNFQAILEKYPSKIEKKYFSFVVETFKHSEASNPANAKAPEFYINYHNVKIDDSNSRMLAKVYELLQKIKNGGGEIQPRVLSHSEPDEPIISVDPKEVRSLADKMSKKLGASLTEFFG